MLPELSMAVSSLSRLGMPCSLVADGWCCRSAHYRRCDFPRKWTSESLARRISVGVTRWDSVVIGDLGLIPTDWFSMEQIVWGVVDPQSSHVHVGCAIGSVLFHTAMFPIAQILAYDTIRGSVRRPLQGQQRDISRLQYGQLLSLPVSGIATSSYTQSNIGSSAEQRDGPTGTFRPCGASPHYAMSTTLSSPLGRSRILQQGGPRSPKCLHAPMECIP